MKKVVNCCVVYKANPLTTEGENTNESIQRVTRSIKS